MQSRRNWWKEKIPWPVRWLVCLTVVVGSFYLVEDIRGALAWQAFIKKHPEFQIKEGEEVTQTEFQISQDLPLYYSDGIYFLKYPTSRDTFFLPREREFPSPPFRYSTNIYPNSFTIPTLGLSEKEAAKVILGDGGEFEEYEPKVSSQFLHILLMRSLAESSLGNDDQAFDLLIRALKIIEEFDNGLSIKRSNDVPIPMMRALQLIWQGQFSESQLNQLKKQLENFQHLGLANHASIQRAKRRCQYIDACRWSFKERQKKWGKWGPLDQVSHLFSLKQKIPIYLSDIRWRIYVTLMPNGWIDQNRIFICRQALLHEQPALQQGPFSFDKTLANRVCFSPALFDTVHRFDPRPTEAFIRCAKVAIEAKSQFLQTGKYPSHIENLPSDPFDEDNKLIYKLDRNGKPVIYSIGPNEKDEGGIPKSKIAEGDIVWRYSLPENYRFEDYLD